MSNHKLKDKQTPAEETVTKPLEALNVPAPEPTPEAVKPARALRTLRLGSFLPAKEILAKEVLGKPKGTKFLAGRVFGFATEATKKSETSSDGRVTEVVILGGVFSASNGKAASTICLTQGYSNFVADKIAEQRIVKIDAELFLETTGTAGSPFQWVVNSKIEPADDNPMKAFAV